MADPLLTLIGTPATTADRVLAVLSGAVAGALLAAFLIKGFVFVLT